jgi:hypothetical protein
MPPGAGGDPGRLCRPPCRVLSTGRESEEVVGQSHPAERTVCHGGQGRTRAIFAYIYINRIAPDPRRARTAIVFWSYSSHSCMRRHAGGGGTRGLSPITALRRAPWVGTAMSPHPACGGDDHWHHPGPQAPAESGAGTTASTSKLPDPACQRADWAREVLIKYAMAVRHVCILYLCPHCLCTQCQYHWQCQSNLVTCQSTTH